jgi:two-component system nitrogen regulation sensor histidine kinase GlnL
MDIAAGRLTVVDDLSLAVVSALPQALVILRPGGVIHSVNPAAEQLFGTSARHLVDHPLRLFLAFDEANIALSLDDDDQQIRARHTPVHIRGRSREFVDYEIFPLEQQRLRAALFSLLPKGNSLAERRRTTNLASDIALNVLAHEVKNPLAAIAGAAQLLARKAREDQRELLALIGSEVSRVVTLFDRLQGAPLGQITAGAAVNVHAVIDRARQTLEAATLKSVPVQCEFDPSLPDVLADDAAMVQILTNLLTNAAEATADMRAPHIVIKTRYSYGSSLKALDRRGYTRLPVEIIVTDNGPGVPADIAEDIFTAFVTSKRTGKGIGLAIVQKLLQQMGARISYERDDQRGLTHFIVHLPVYGDAALRAVEAKP